EERLGSPVCVISPVTDSTELEPRPGIELDPGGDRGLEHDPVHETWPVGEGELFPEGAAEDHRVAAHDSGHRAMLRPRSAEDRSVLAAQIREHRRLARK